MKNMEHADVMKYLRIAGVAPGWPTGATQAEHEAKTRDFRELLEKMGLRNAARMSVADPGAGDPDLIGVHVAAHRDDGRGFLVYVASTPDEPRQLAAVPLDEEGIAFIVSDAFPAKRRRAENAALSAKRAVWDALDRERQAVMILIARTPEKQRKAVADVCESFSRILVDLPIDSVMPAEVEPMIDPARAPSPEEARRVREEKKEAKQLQKLREQRLAQQKEWADDAVREEARLRAFLHGGPLPKPRVRDVSGDRKTETK